MDWMTSLQQAIDYVENNLTEDLDPDEIARKAYSSTFHFTRTFGILTGFTLGEYIRNRRLSMAALELSRTQDRVLDIALKYGYETHESFTKAFQRQHGITPSAAREPGATFRMFNRLSIQVVLKGEKEMNVRFEERNAFVVYGQHKQFNCANNTQQAAIPMFWDEANKSGLMMKLGKATNDEMGIMGICTNLQGDMMDYWIASCCANGVPEGMEALEIPAANWAVFESVGPMPHAIQNLWHRIFSEWFPTSGYEHSMGPEIEVYSLGDATSADYKSWVWLPVVRK